MGSTTRRQMLAGGGAALGGALLSGSAASEAEAWQTRADSVQASPGPARLAGKVALVTGAARGIGRAIAADLARNGAAVALLDIADSSGAGMALHGYQLSGPAELDAAVAEVESHGGRALPVVADVRSLAQMRAAADRAASELGGVDIVVANAGIVAWSPLEHSTEAQWKDVVDVNVTGVMNTVWATLPHLKQREAGRIITLSSIGGRMGVVGNGAYSPTKWAVIGLTKSLALELGAYGITVNSVAPTGVDTPMYRSEGQLRSTNMQAFADQDRAMLGYHALPTASLQPRDIADAVTFLAGDQARWISGLVLDVAAGGNARYTG